jgi:hypothetical protein
MGGLVNGALEKLFGTDTMNASEIITLAAKGNVDAENFCKAWCGFAHTLDDCADKDKPVTPDAIARTFTAYTLELAGNPFFQAHKGLLVGLMVQSANYWVASHDRSPTERDITKCFWHAVIYEVAHLVGGWEHMSAVTRKTLQFDYEPLTEYDDLCNQFGAAFKKGTQHVCSNSHLCDHCGSAVEIMGSAELFIDGKRFFGHAGCMNALKYDHEVMSKVTPK